jgi:hypothetical protein
MQFKDSNLQKKYDRYGYLVIDLLSAEDIARLRDLYQSLNILPVADFQVSNYEKDAEKNRFIDQEIKKVLLPKLDACFQNFRPLNGFFYIKFATPDSSFYIHKDWNIVDEEIHQSMHIWVPLTNTNATNGNLFFCPLEYILNRKSLRGSPGFEYPAPGFMIKQINKIYQKDIYTKAGQAICFKHSMTHGSRKNKTTEVRVAAGISITDTDAQLVHYHRDKSGNIREYEVNEDFFLDFNLTEIPSVYNKYKKINENK